MSRTLPLGLGYLALALGLEQAVLPIVGEEVGFAQLTQVRLMALGAIPAAAGKAPSDAIVGQIVEATGGNPFFINEIVRLLDAEGRIEGDAAGEPVPLPNEVRHVIRGRLARVSPDCRALLVVASAIGDEIGLEPLEPVAELDRKTILNALEEAEREGLVTEVAGSLGRHRFAHGLVRESLYEELSAADQAELHGRIGEALEALHAGAADPPVAELATQPRGVQCGAMFRSDWSTSRG